MRAPSMPTAEKHRSLASLYIVCTPALHAPEDYLLWDGKGEAGAILLEEEILAGFVEEEVGVEVEEVERSRSAGDGKGDGDAAAGGWAVLMGVTLSSCTAIHIAEERAGRRPFMRWALDRQDRVRVVRVCGCAKGFDHLFPHCQALFREGWIGSSRVLTAPLSSLIERLTPVIREHPAITRCSDSCLRCRDAELGGPIEGSS